MRHGFLLIDKPIGPTSHDAVQQVRRLLNEQKAGHLRTLDPNASGLLVIAVGAKALKVIEFFGELPKQYEAHVRLGAVSTTYDAEGQVEKVEPKQGWSIPEQGTIQRLIEDRFTGTINQVPPIHSAVHVNGQRAYELARRNAVVQLAARSVDVHECTILSYQYPELRLRVGCGSGTYIRSLAHDLGQLLHCGGYLENLRRTKVGEWSVDDAAKPTEAAWARVLPLKDVLASFPRIELNPEEAEDIRHGRIIHREIAPDTFGWYEDLPIAVLEPVKPGAKTAKPRKVF